MTREVTLQDNVQGMSESTVSLQPAPKGVVRRPRQKRGQVDVQPTDTIMFIDHSYYLFYRYYALYKWYTVHQKKEIDTTDVLGDAYFMEKFTDIYKRSIEKLYKKYKVHPSRVCLAVDCERRHIWRNAIYDNYKGDRGIPSHFDPRVFKHILNEVLPTLSTSMGVSTLSVPQCEADDVIAISVKHIRRTNPETPIVIITNDKDYLQLYDEKTQIINLQNKNLGESGKYTKGNEYLLTKIIMGDKSDGILPISKKGCGPAAVDKYLSDPNHLQTFLGSNPEIAKRFAENQTLIDFQYIPQSLQLSITRKFEELKILL
jgi:5'-3' exonuclease